MIRRRWDHVPCDDGRNSHTWDDRGNTKADLEKCRCTTCGIRLRFDEITDNWWYDDVVIQEEPGIEDL